MKSRMNKKYIQIGIVAFLVIVCSILFFFLFFQMENFKSGINRFIATINPILYGLIIAYILTPIVNFFERKVFYPIVLNKSDIISPKKKRVIRAISVVITIVIIITLISILLMTVIPQVIESITSLSLMLPTYIAGLQNWGNNLWINNQEWLESIGNLVNVKETDFIDFFNNSLVPSIKTWAVGLSSGVLVALKSVWNVVIGIIISIYVLMNKELFAAQAKKIMYALFSRPRANLIIKDTRFVSDTFVGFLGGKIVDSFIIFLLCLFGCSILRMPYAILISVIVGITNIIPFFGPFIGAVPSAFLILIVDPLKCLYFIIFILVLQQVDGNIIGPLILGDSTGLSGFWVIFSITVFGGIWGVVGMIVGIPIFAVVYALIKRYIERLLRRKNLPEDTNAYKPLKNISDDGEFIELFEANDLNFKKEKKTAKEATTEVIDLIKNYNKKDDANPKHHNELSSQEELDEASDDN